MAGSVQDLTGGWLTARRRRFDVVPAAAVWVSHLAPAHEAWRWRHLQELLTRWELVAAAVSKPGYAQALGEARLGAGQYVTLEDVVTRRPQHS